MVKFDEEKCIKAFKQYSEENGNILVSISLHDFMAGAKWLASQEGTIPCEAEKEPMVLPERKLIFKSDIKDEELAYGNYEKKMISTFERDKNAYISACKSLEAKEEDFELLEAGYEECSCLAFTMLIEDHKMIERLSKAMAGVIGDGFETLPIAKEIEVYKNARAKRMKLG